MVLPLLLFNQSFLVGWDDSFYWCQLTSLWHDRDLRLQDDILASWNTMAVQRDLIQGWPEGRLGNTFSIGPALLQGVVVGPVVLVQRFLGDCRFGAPTLLAAGVASLFQYALLWCGLHVLSRRLGAGKELVLPVALTVVVGTPLLVYSLRVYSMAHLLSALTTVWLTIALFAWVTNPSRCKAFACGLLFGFVVVTRWQDAIYLALIALLFGYRALWGANRRHILSEATLFAVAAFPILACQAAVWQKVFGSCLLMPQGNGYMHWMQPAFSSFLFSGYHGAFSWHPALAVGGIGLVVGAVRQTGLRRFTCISMLLVFALAVYVNACVADWYGGASFGARRMTSLTPLILAGFVEVVRGIRTRVAWWLASGLVLYGLVVFAFYTGGCDDLSVVFRGTKSADAPADGNPAQVIDRAAAFRNAGKGWGTDFVFPKPLMRRIKPRWLWQVFAVVAVTGSFGAAYRSIILLGRSGRARAGACAVAFAYACAFAVFVSGVVPSNHPFDACWGHCVTSREPLSGECAAMIPPVALDFLESWEKVQAGSVSEARETLGKARPQFFPASIQDYYWKDPKGLSGSVRPLLVSPR